MDNVQPAGAPSVVDNI